MEDLGWESSCERLGVYINKLALEIKSTNTTCLESLVDFFAWKDRKCTHAIGVT
jgi:hypothetical protein